MEVEYFVVDTTTDLIHGPYANFNHARTRADDFPAWEIVDADGGIFDWSPAGA